MTMDWMKVNTLVTMARAATAASPYILALKFSAIVDRDRMPWRKKEGIPCFRMDR